MPLNKGDKAPDFTLPSTNGKNFKLSDYSEAVVLFFYPKDFTEGCTKQSCLFRDNYDDFRSLNMKVFGISPDSISRHHEFKNKLKLPFELLSDPNGEVSKKYKSWIPILNVPKRVTYLIDENNIIQQVHQSMFDFKSHISKILSLK